MGSTGTSYRAHMRATLPTQGAWRRAHAEGIPVLLHSCGNLTAISG